MTTRPSDRLAVGVACLPRELASGSNGTAQGVTRLTYFTSPRSMTATKARTATTTVAAGATPTLCKVGVYEVAGNGDLTLLGATANTPSLWANQNATYETALTTPVDIVAGVRYAFAIIIVTAAQVPNLVGMNYPSANSAASLEPRLMAAVPAQTDLAPSYTAAAAGVTGNRYYGVLLP